MIRFSDLSQLANDCNESIARKGHVNLFVKAAGCIVELQCTDCTLDTGCLELSNEDNANGLCIEEGAFTSFYYDDETRIYDLEYDENGEYNELSVRIVE